MSHEATVWAISRRGLPAAAKVVLWHLADRFHPDHGCFPKQATLANDCELSKSSLNTQLEILEKAGLIRRERRIDPATKQQMPTRYRFAFEAGFGPGSGAAGAVVQCEKEQPEAGADCEKPSPDSGLGSGGPSPEIGQSRVQLFGLGYKAEPVSEPVSERESAQAQGQGCAPAEASEPVAAQQEGLAEKGDGLLALRLAYPNAGYDAQAELEAAWHDLPAAAQRAAIEALPEYLAGAKRAGRRHVPKAADYLTKQLWLVAETQAAATRAERARPAPSAADGLWTCAAWSRDWWALLLARCAAGKPVSMLVERARGGGEMTFALAEKPGEAAIAALSQHRGDSDHFEAWRRWLARRGAHIDRKPATTWVWLPGDPPPCEPESGKRFPAQSTAKSPPPCEPEKPVPDSIRDGGRFPAQSTAKSPPPCEPESGTRFPAQSTAKSPPPDG